VRRRFLMAAYLGLAMLLAVAAGCADEGMRPKPEPDHVTLSGRVRLEGRLTDATNNLLGIERIDDADEIPVVLSGPGGMRDSTHTHEGAFVFSDLPPGTYRVSSPIGASREISLPETTLDDRDVILADTLVLGPSGDLAAYPNPAPAEGIGLEFTAHAQQMVTVEIYHTDGDLIWSYSQELPPIYYHIHWPGTDQDGHAAETGAYWAIVHVDGEEQVGLIFWSTDEEPSPGNCGHIDAAGLFLEENATAIATEWDGAMRGGIDLSADGETDPIHLLFLREDSTAFAVADTCPSNHLTWEIADPTIAEANLETGTKWSFHVHGLKAGSTTITLNAWHEGHIHLTSLPIPIVVTPAFTPPTAARAGRSARSSWSVDRSAAAGRGGR
jgi:hypothetical protein